MRITRFGALAELVNQHDGLRRMMDTCERLADELDVGGVEPERLTSELARLRAAFEAHNGYEEAILRPVLLAEDSHGKTRVERMVEDHIHEHREIRMRLGTPATAELRDVIDTLRAHLDAEERYLLSSKVLLENRPLVPA